jgi:hypothetical protein
MTRAIPLNPGEMFGRWKVLEQAGGHPTTGEILYWVECSCGSRRKRLGSLLRGGKTKSCRKCMLSSRLQDLTGERFGLLLVLGRVPNSSPLRWKCKCTGCGRIRKVAGFNLRSGRSLSCGSCGKRKKHGHARAGAKSYYYQIWARTVHLNRGNPSPPIYRRWKGKGGFIRFFQDVLDNIGPKPEQPGVRFIRLDTSQGFFPGNIAWQVPKPKRRKRGLRHKRCSPQRHRKSDHARAPRANVMATSSGRKRA